MKKKLVALLIAAVMVLSAIPMFAVSATVTAAGAETAGLTVSSPATITPGTPDELTLTVSGNVDSLNYKYVAGDGPVATEIIAMEGSALNADGTTKIDSTHYGRVTFLVIDLENYLNAAKTSGLGGSGSWDGNQFRIKQENAALKGIIGSNVKDEIATEIPGDGRYTIPLTPGVNPVITMEFYEAGNTTNVQETLQINVTNSVTMPDLAVDDSEWNFYNNRTLFAEPGEGLDGYGGILNDPIHRMRLVADPNPSVAIDYTYNIIDEATNAPISRTALNDKLLALRVGEEVKVKVVYNPINGLITPAPVEMSLRVSEDPEDLYAFIDISDELTGWPENDKIAVGQSFTLNFKEGVELPSEQENWRIVNIDPNDEKEYLKVEVNSPAKVTALAEGTATVEYIYVDYLTGEVYFASVDIEVVAAAQNGTGARTGDSNNMLLFVGLGALAVMAGAGVVVAKRRASKNED